MVAEMLLEETQAKLKSAVAKEQKLQTDLNVTSEKANR